MAWKKRTPKHPWRKYLTQEEADRIDSIDADAQKIDADRRALTTERGRIVNRAINRLKYKTSAGAKP